MQAQAVGWVEARNPAPTSYKLQVEWIPVMLGFVKTQPSLLTDRRNQMDAFGIYATRKEIDR